MSGYRREGHLGKEAEEQRRLEVASGSGSTILPLLLRVGSQMMHCPPHPFVYKPALASGRCRCEDHDEHVDTAEGLSPDNHHCKRAECAHEARTLYEGF